MAEADAAGTRVMIEYPISSPVHKDFYGTCDFACVVKGTEHHGQENLVVVDFKYGAGIQVDAEENPQLMYYAYGVLQEFPECDKVRVVIVQPRGFHADGPVRAWDTTAEHIRTWVAETLKPAMERVEFDHALEAGKWCRFCPAKLVCPLLSGLFKAAALANPAEIVNYSPEALARSYEYLDAVKFYTKALQDEALARLQKGKSIPGLKLVHGRGSRAWALPEDQMAEKLIKMGIPKSAVYETKLVTPAKAEKLTWEKKDGTKVTLTERQLKRMDQEYVSKLAGKITVVPESDGRPAVIMNAAPLFSAVEAAPAAEPLPSWLS